MILFAAVRGLNSRDINGLGFLIKATPLSRSLSKEPLLQTSRSANGWFSQMRSERSKKLELFKKSSSFTSNLLVNLKLWQTISQERKVGF